jgi:hypothetical protein
LDAGRAGFNSPLPGSQESRSLPPKAREAMLKNRFMSVALVCGLSGCLWACGSDDDDDASTGGSAGESASTGGRSTGGRSSGGSSSGGRTDSGGSTRDSGGSAGEKASSGAGGASPAAGGSTATGEGGIAGTEISVLAGAGGAEATGGAQAVGGQGGIAGTEISFLAGAGGEAPGGAGGAQATGGVAPAGGGEGGIGGAYVTVLAGAGGAPSELTDAEACSAICNTVVGATGLEACTTEATLALTVDDCTTACSDWFGVTQAPDEYGAAVHCLVSVPADGWHCETGMDNGVIFGAVPDYSEGVACEAEMCAWACADNTADYVWWAYCECT